MLLPGETGAREPTNRLGLGLYVHISKLLLYLYRFVPRSGLDNFPEYICLTGVFRDFPFGPCRQMHGRALNPMPFYLSPTDGVKCVTALAFTVPPQIFAGLGRSPVFYSSHNTVTVDEKGAAFSTQEKMTVTI
jgi:hypothetical protein